MLNLKWTDKVTMTKGYFYGLEAFSHKTINYKGKNGNFTAEKPGRQYLNQVITGNFTNNEMH